MRFPAVPAFLAILLLLGTPAWVRHDRASRAPRPLLSAARRRRSTRSRPHGAAPATHAQLRL